MNVRVEEPTPYLRRIHLTIPARDVDVVFQKVINEFRTRAHVPGFRSNKIPLSVILQRFRKPIEGQVLNELLEPLLPEAISNAHASPVSAPKLDHEGLAQGSDLRVQVEFEVLPQLRFENFDNLEITVPVQPVQETDIDRRLESMRAQDAQDRKVEGREGVIWGDVVVFDYVVRVNGEQVDQATGSLLEMGSGRWDRSVEQALSRARIGVPVEASITLPSSFRERGLAGKPATMECIVREIREKVLPDLDDDWARDHGQADLAGLRNEVAVRLEREQQEQRLRSIDEAIIQKLVEQYPVELPPTLAAQQAEEHWVQFAKVFGIDARSAKGEEYASLRQLSRSQADRQLRQVVIARSIVAQERLEVSDEELEQKIAELARASNTPPAKVRAAFAKEEARTGLRNELIQEKMMTFLRSQAKVTEQAETPEAPGADEHPIIQLDAQPDAPQGVKPGQIILP